MLDEWTEKGKLKRYEIETKKQKRSFENRRNLLKRIITDASTKTVFLSQYEEYQDEGVRQYYEERCRENERSLAKQLFYDLNQMALDEAGELSGFILPFHCYSDPNGDVVFTKNKRTRNDYDKNGHAVVSEKNGCLGIVLLGLLLTSIIIII